MRRRRRNGSSEGKNCVMKNEARLVMNRIEGDEWPGMRHSRDEPMKGRLGYTFQGAVRPTTKAHPPEAQPWWQCTGSHVALPHGFPIRWQPAGVCLAANTNPNRLVVRSLGMWHLSTVKQREIGGKRGHLWQLQRPCSH